MKDPRGYVNGKIDRVAAAVAAGDGEQAARVIDEFAAEGHPEVAREVYGGLLRAGLNRVRGGE